jgi:CheY-like chemotaxis protein
MNRAWPGTTFRQESYEAISLETCTVQRSIGVGMTLDLPALLQRADPAAIPAIAQPASSSQTILIVEGSGDSLLAMCEALAGENYGVQTAGSGTPMAQKIAARRPDLILLDSQLLDADGTRLAHRLLADDDLASVPIVALTKIVAFTNTATGPHAVGGAGGSYDGEVQIPIDKGVFAAQVRALLQSSAQESAGLAADLVFPYGAELDRPMEAAQLLDLIENGLPDSQFSPGIGPALQRLAEVEGLRHLVLAGYLERAERLSHASTVRARSRFRLIVGI